ncbi:MAG TPA: MFS transporter [Pseudomonadales bacterium]
MTSRRRFALLAICYLGFVSLGLPDTLIGVAWPSVRDHFRLAQDHVAWIFFGSGCSYLLSSFFAGRLLARMNVGLLLAGSSALVALGGFNHGLATVWPWFVLGALLHGLGSGAIDAGLNHYVATRLPARHMNWLHASYSVGAMLGPVVMTASLTLAGSWRLGYLLVAALLGALALVFLASRARWLDAAPAEDSTGAAPRESLHEPPTLPHPEPTRGGSRGARQALGHRAVRLNLVLFFLYTGFELGLGQWSFTILTESRNVPAATAGAWVTVYWAGILIGRFLLGFVVDRMSIDRLVRGSLVTALLGAALFVWNPLPQAAPVALALGGLGLAVVFPCLMTRTPQRVGHGLAGHAIGLQVGAAMLGGAALPSLGGVVAEHMGVERVAPMLLIVAAILLVLHERLVRITGGGDGPAGSPEVSGTS